MTDQIVLWVRVIMLLVIVCLSLGRALASRHDRFVNVLSTIVSAVYFLVYLESAIQWGWDTHAVIRWASLILFALWIGLLLPTTTYWSD